MSEFDQVMQLLKEILEEIKKQPKPENHYHYHYDGQTWTIQPYYNPPPFTNPQWSETML